MRLVEKVASGVALYWILAQLSLTGTASQARSEDREIVQQQLVAIGKRLTAAIEIGNAEEFLSFCSRRGVVFGTDQPEIPLREMRKQIRGKYGIHCLLFDTSCLRKQVGFERRYSLRDLISAASKKELKVGIVREPGVFAGDVRIYLKGGPIENVPAMNPLEFQFFRERGFWKLGVVPY